MHRKGAKARIEQANGRWGRPCAYHKSLKRRKARVERRRAKAQPDCAPGYGRYRSYET